MDRWKFFDITHKFHTLMNPISEEKIDYIIDRLQLKPKSKVIDIGCGKGEFLIRLGKKIKFEAKGVDLSPPAIKEAKERTAITAPNLNIEYI